MPIHRPAVLEFLHTRRSCPLRTLAAPAPDRAALREMLTAAARSPDHGKLEPWRFVVLERGALDRLADLVRLRGPALGKDAATIDKAANAYLGSPLAVAVIASSKPSEKVPEIEQIYSAGAVCLALVNAVLASGWGAAWMSGWASHDRDFVEQGLGVAPHEQVAGIVHIGTATAAPPERPRPDIDAITEWRAE
ncbi:nitroreductase family protein [Rhodovulum adriaticum]|uniref:Putative NAD(P)H nitroreductase n=1 Tax=Rhodovulum adriaticum TaxID=35804 RepID=A0A4R2NWC0_RHOAD|nr:nitroreductase [Rhodovulum adriaticum]MBK1636404.1 nitroreductase [Rhodovulum adriaticum]TCP26459.1 nitroreductase [Rhodovulum adriaticum]